MKKIIRTAAYIILAVAAAGCAKHVSEGPNEPNLRYFNAWIKMNYPDAKPTGLGIYVIEEEEGTGLEVKEDGFVYTDYVITDLEGNISEYTDKNTAKRLGEYDTTLYYGPKVLTTIKQTLPAGVAEALIGMKEGGRKKVIIPSWLMTYSAFDTEEEYLNNSTTAKSAIYDLTVRNYADSIQLHEIALIRDYMEENAKIFTNFQNDTTGFYYQTLKKGNEEEPFKKDTTIYINYTGKLLNGLVFDTTVERVAKDNGLYSASKTYEPVKVNWKEEWSEISMGSDESSIISGFALTISKMLPMEKGIGVFYSPLGYSYSGSGKSIPGYSPLVFEIEIVAKPE